jgi:hypothetical protein
MRCILLQRECPALIYRHESEGFTVIHLLNEVYEIVNVEFMGKLLNHLFIRTLHILLYPRG